MHSTISRVFLPAALVAAFAVSQASAAILYGDFSDIPPGAVMYLDVEEDSATDPVPPALYGPPSVSVNLLDFDPTGFGATSTGGPLDITDGQLNFSVMTLPGAGLTGLVVVEEGDYSFVGAGGAGTTVSASASIRVEILEVDGTPLVTPIEIFEVGTFGTDMATAGGASGLLEWDLSVLADFGPYLPTGFEVGVTKAEISINNQLTTNSEEDSLAFIAKKDFKITPIGDLDPDIIVPEPTAAVLALVGSALAFVRRRNG